jgi:hypothetical protein
MEKGEIFEKQQEIIQLAKKFCDDKLNEEYSMLAEKLIRKLGRKRSAPFVTGQTAIWAAAVIHALGSINFLFDKSFEPYISADEINDFFGTKKSTIGNKSREIRDLLNLNYWDMDFSTERMLNKNPFANFVMVDGFMVPVNELPKEFQKIVQQVGGKGGIISISPENDF